MANARKILIVDDDTDLRDTLVEQLSLHDEFEASAVDTGAKAWLPRIEQRILRFGEVVPGRAINLAPSELRVAELARSGATNREIAASLYLSVKTVEATLSRIYRKL